jgi:hypothetical protein
MKRYLLIYSAWISLLLIPGTSCRSARISYSGEQEANSIDSVALGSFEKRTFKTEVTWGEREISGLMLVKNTGDGHFKIAFYNELGMTYLEGTLDMLQRHPRLIVKNIAPAIDYKPFIKNFERCLQAAVSPENPDHRESGLLILDNRSMTIELKNGFKMDLSILANND